MSVIKLPAMPQPDGLMSDKNGDNATLVWSKEKLQSYARAAVEADRAQRVPDGWKLVPIEPTPKMLVALWEHRERMRGRGENAIAMEGYSALLASTPAQPAPQPVERKPMTPEQVAETVFEVNGNEPSALFWRDLVSAVERHHGIKE